MKSTRLVAAGLLSGIFLSTPASGEEFAFLGSRCQAMGGACVAVAQGAQSAYWNPGALAFEDGYDVQIPAGATIAAVDDVFRDLDNIIDFVNDNDVNGIVDDIEAANTLDVDDVGTTLDLLLNELPNLGADQGFVGSVEGGLAMRLKRVAVTGLSLTSFGANPVLDITDLALSSAGSAGGRVGDLVDNLPAAGALTGDGQSVADDIAGLAGFSQAEAESLVFQAEQVADLSDPETASTLLGIAQATSLGGGDLSENRSGAFVQGLLTIEAGVAYGHPLNEIPFLEEVPFLDRIGLGGNVKYIRGYTYFNSFRYNNVDEAGDIVDDLLSFDSRKSDNDWGIDLGVLVQATDWMRVGLVGRNLNSPSFDVKSQNSLLGAAAEVLALTPGKTFVLEPQARMGAAVNPIPNWLISMDLDLTKNKSEALKGYRSRLFSLGTEVQIPIWKLGLAPRAGIYLNTADGVDHSPVITAGLGIKIFYFVLDLAAGVSTDFVPFEAAGGVDKIPSRANLSAALKWTQTF